MGYRKHTYKDSKLISVHDDRVLEEEMTLKLEALKELVSDELQLTDWMVVRYIDPSSNKNIPADVLSRRDVLRKAQAVAEREILACKTLEELDACKWVVNFKD